MADRRYFIDVFEDIMTNVQLAYGSVSGDEPYAIYGDRNEVIDVLKEKDNNKDYKFKKYPLVILYKGVPEKRGDINQQFEFTISPLISIVTISKSTLKTADRYDENVKPILMPIYELLMQEIADNPNIYESYKEEINHVIKVWNGSPNDADKGILYQDYLDGIDIQISDLRIFRHLTCTDDE